MEEYCPDDDVQKLESEFWNHMMGLAPKIKAHVTSSKHTIIQGDVSMANRLTTDGIKDELFKKKENAGNKRRVRTRVTSICWSTSEMCKMQLWSFWRNFPRMNQATTSRGNRLNPMLAIEGNLNQGNNRNRAQGRAFGLGVAEAPQDPNVVTGTFSPNDHFAIVLFDSGADYSFLSTNFLPLINMKPSVISHGYEIQIASGIKVETNKIIRGCRLELEGHTFIINLIPFKHGSFDVLVGMDWLSKLRAKIVCFEKIFQILLSNGDILEVHRERPKWNLKQLKTMKVNDPKLEDIPIVRDFPSVFPKDLSGLPPPREVEFSIDLIP
ncbi:putative reverse transcriptase domain-containing protein [Tanacetum coccineum]|uniref:Reverse transcriptase domain-containing protein n=1 Tax=Tanacetum coccineum TaxID=301880 RepID=A0ABQ5AG67_9ASTR